MYKMKKRKGKNNRNLIMRTLNYLWVRIFIMYENEKKKRSCEILQVQKIHEAHPASDETKKK